MKRLLTLSLLLAISMTSCSKEEENNASLSKSSYTLYHSENKNIQGTNVSNLRWEPENEFVATISNGTIKGLFVGKTTVRESAHRLSFAVEVKPKYNLYNDPDMNWGASMTTIRNRYGIPYSSDSKTLLYKNNNNYAPYYMYIFENGKLLYSSVVVPLSAGSALVDFLSERYLALNVDMNTYTATFSHCYGKMSDPKIDYSVAFTYSSSVKGFLVVYAQNTSSKSKLSSVDVSQHIENILRENNIEVE